MIIKLFLLTALILTCLIPSGTCADLEKTVAIVPFKKLSKDPRCKDEWGMSIANAIMDEVNRKARLYNEPYTTKVDETINISERVLLDLIELELSLQEDYSPAIREEIEKINIDANFMIAGTYEIIDDLICISFRAINLDERKPIRGFSGRVDGKKRKKVQDQIAKEVANMIFKQTYLKPLTYSQRLRWTNTKPKKALLIGTAISGLTAVVLGYQYKQEHKEWEEASFEDYYNRKDKAEKARDNFETSLYATGGFLAIYLATVLFTPEQPQNTSNEIRLFEGGALSADLDPVNDNYAIRLRIFPEKIFRRLGS